MKISEQESEGGMDGRSGEGERKGEIKKRRMRKRERENAQLSSRVTLPSNNFDNST